MSNPTEAPAAPATPAAPKLSAVEGIKAASRQLRGTIAEELASGVDHFNDQTKQLIKFHGSYQQDDRDGRKNRRKEGVGKYYMFMVRCKIPGGRVTADQYLAVDAIADKYANGTLRFTTRQGIQFHGILMANLKKTIAEINDCLLSTLGACGDVERNVMACPAPLDDGGIRAELQETAALIATHLAPRSRAYHEIWLNGERADGRAHELDLEPIYGKVYLPRKFKTGLGLPDDNCIDIYAQDLGLLAIVEHGKIAGYNVLVGGGMGMTHGNPNTFPHLAQPICYVPAKAVLNAAEAVVKLFRDHGNRGDRKRARIKYLVHDWGVEKFRQVLSEYLGGPVHLPRPVTVTGFETHTGWHPQAQGQWFYGVSVENGRVKDEGTFRLRTALKLLVERFRPDLRITANQDILLCNLDEAAKPEVERILQEHGVKHAAQLSQVRLHSMACPAIPTCGLAISESERSLPSVIDQLETELTRLGLEHEKIAVRMTGCPNGCARPYQSDIGLVGRSGEKYLVYVGGNVIGDRLNFPLRDLVPISQIVPTLSPVLEQYQQQRTPGERFGDFCHRLGADALQKLLPPLVGKQPEKKEAVNGEAHAASKPATANGEAKPVPNPAAVNGTPAVQAAPKPEPARQLLPLPQTQPRTETFYVGPRGEEVADYAFRYDSDGKVRETVVYYYGDDARAAAAHPGEPLRREAVYQGQANPFRLHAARKLNDTFYVGAPRQELRDRRVDYYPDGRPAQTTISYYDGDSRAAQAPTGAVLRRQASFEGQVS
ncbi:MAG: NADPH-dependent assimilatory sulfite reductase hemoprotein subunit [Planctomycetia bacterium]|nr:NADPH-dependent assimilatory sulfite reductase hemoprotein subunit [Planctomycetia bacterium]